MKLIGEFKGKDGSMGFKTGQVYNLMSEVRNSCITLFDVNNPRRYCPYSTVGAMLENWELHKEYTPEELEKERKKFNKEFEETFGNPYKGSDFY